MKITSFFAGQKQVQQISATAIQPIHSVAWPPHCLMASQCLAVLLEMDARQPIF
jgi:hypothetical protein